MKFSNLELRESNLLSSLSNEEKLELLNSLKDYVTEYRNTLRISPYVTFGYGMEYNHTDKNLKSAMMSQFMQDMSSTWKDLDQTLSSLNDSKTNVNSSYITIGSQIMNYNPKSFLNLVKMSLVFYPQLSEFINGSMTTLEKSDYQKILDNDNFNSYLTVLNALNGKNGLPISFNYVRGLEQSDNSFITVDINPTLDKVTFQNTINFILNFIIYANSKKFDDKKIDELYQGLALEQSKMEKDFLLADLIFKTNLDKINYLKQVEQVKSK